MADRIRSYLGQNAVVHNGKCSAEYYLINSFTRFLPEQLAITATSAFLSSFVEIVAVLLFFYKYIG